MSIITPRPSCQRRAGCSLCCTVLYTCFDARVKFRVIIRRPSIIQTGRQAGSQSAGQTACASRRSLRWHHLTRHQHSSRHKWQFGVISPPYSSRLLTFARDRKEPHKNRQRRQRSPAPKIPYYFQPGIALLLLSAVSCRPTFSKSATTTTLNLRAFDRSFVPHPPEDPIFYPLLPNT